MTDVRTRLSMVDRVPVPGLWEEARRRAAREEPVNLEPSAPNTGWARVATVAVAVALVAVGVTLAWRAFDPTVAPRPGTAPAPAPEASDPWRDLQPGLHELPDPPVSRFGQAVAWTGSELFMWGGAVDDGALRFNDGFIFDAERRAWEELPPSPLSPAYFPTTVWTGHEVVIWGGWDGGSTFFDDGAAYDPATGTWRMVPPAPIEGRYAFGSVWTGKEMVVWGGGRAQPGRLVDGAAYDPVANTWRRITDAPFALNDGATVWTGDEMIVIGAWLGDGNRSATPTAVGAAYDPSADAWRQIAASDLSPQALDAVWTGKEVIAVDYNHHVQAYIPSTDRWRDLPPLPLDDGEYSPQAASAAQHVVVDTFTGVAGFRLRTETWDELMLGPGWDVIPAGTAFILMSRSDSEPFLAYAWKPVTDANWKERGGPALEWVAVLRRLLLRSRSRTRGRTRWDGSDVRS